MTREATDDRVMLRCKDCGTLTPTCDFGPDKGKLTRHLAPCGAICAMACSVPDRYDGDHAELHHAPMRLSAHEELEPGECPRGCYPPNQTRRAKIARGLAAFKEWIKP